MAGFNYNMMGYNFESKDIFTGFIGEDGTIYSQSFTNGNIAVGVDNKVVQEMQETIDNYYNKLVELGVIVPQKTQEEIAQQTALEQQEINQQLLQAINNLNNQVKELSSNGNDRNGITEDSQIIRKKSTGNTTSISTSKKNATTKSK